MTAETTPPGRPASRRGKKDSLHINSISNATDTQEAWEPVEPPEFAGGPSPEPRREGRDTGARHFATAAELLPAWRDSVLSGRQPELWTVGGEEWEAVEIGPGLVVLLGGAPGAGKTSLAMQWTLEALRRNENLRALVANVEMSPQTLLERQLARLAGVDSRRVRFRALAGFEEKIRHGMDTLAGIADRLAFHTGGPVLADVARSADASGARLLVLDYVQRFTLGVGADAPDKRTELDGIMNQIRRLADTGLGVLAVSAVARQKGKGGSNYGGLGLASFRGSSELEYGADSAWLLSPVNRLGMTMLTCEKNRHGETGCTGLAFDKPRQSFSVELSEAPAPGADGYENDDEAF